MFWPLIGGFIALIVIVLLLGRIMDVPPSADADEHRH
jgi:hypothetical protein